MRAVAAVLVAAALAVPGTSHAGVRGPAYGRRAASSAVARRGPVRAVPAPPRQGGAARVAPAPPRGSGGGAVVAPAWRPFWWAGAWGFGYYPLFWPARPPVAEVPRPVSMQLAFSGAASSNGMVGGVSVFVDAAHAGVHLGFDTLGIDPRGALPGQDFPALGRGTFHGTWSLASGPSYRVRLEVGGAFLSVPLSGGYVGAPYAGNIVFGPDVGISGHLGLVGPIGVEAHARFMPYPVALTDVRTALAMRAGRLAATAGWRSIEVAGDDADAPSAWFDGPEIGLQLAF